ncbi:MAG: RnfABCDGE type electron transport complex subunit G [Thermodesulfobacteriota bacterium]
MREMVKMVITLTILAAFSGGLLAAVKTSTSDRIEQAVLEYVQGPAILSIMSEVSNDPLADRFTLEIDGEQVDFFVGKKNGVPEVVAFETKASGYGGDIGVMVGVNIDSGEIYGIDVTTHSETPGVGARAETDIRFKTSFEGIPVADEEKIQIGDDGGDIAAIGGATVTSRAVSLAVRRAGNIFEQHKSEIKKEVDTFSG